jgi:predicted nucleic acid-binding protein
VPRFYLDTSAILKKYLPEKGSEVVHEIYKDSSLTLRSVTTYIRILTSYIGVIESLGLAGRLHNSRTIRKQAYRTLVANMMRDFDSVDVLPK